MEATIRKICARYGLAGETIRPLPGGQVNQVYLIDDAYVLRIGAREDAAQRLKQESQLLRELSGEMPVPELLAFDEQDGLAYQLQRYVRGHKLHMVWKELRPDEKERITAELAGYLHALHRVAYPDFGRPSADAPHAASWMEYFTRRFENILAEIRALGIPIPADLLDMATGYFEQNRSALQAGTPTRLHGDLWLGGSGYIDGGVK